MNKCFIIFITVLIASSNLYATLELTYFEISFESPPSGNRSNTVETIGTFPLASISPSGTDLKTQQMGLFDGLSLDTVIGTATNQILSDFLVYPNPFSIREGAEIGYELNQNMDTTLKIFSITGHLIYEQSFVSGQTQGALQGYNKIPISRDVLGRDLPVGVYFFFLFNNDTLLAKDKMMVKP